MMRGWWYQVEFDPKGGANRRLWRYRVKVYKGDTLIETGRTDSRLCIRSVARKIRREHIRQTKGERTWRRSL